MQIERRRMQHATPPLFNFQFSILITAVVALASIASCRPGREAQTTDTAGDIPVGVYAALTGDQASFGNATVQGVKLAAEEINASGGVLGRKIRLVIEDDAGKPDQTASMVTKLI